MKRKTHKIIMPLVLCIVTVLGLGMTTNAQTNDNFQPRTEEEIVVLKRDFQKLFPEQYHYIETYEKDGVLEMEPDQVTTIFDETKAVGEKEYNLIVFNNGQVFLNTSELVSKKTSGNGKTRALETTAYTKKFTVGDVGKYATFKATYVIELRGYDTLSSCDVVRSDFILYPFNKQYKRVEDSSGNAYFGYVNCPTNIENAGIMYDVGVKVGNNRAKGFAKVSTGLDAAIWYMLNAYV